MNKITINNKNKLDFQSQVKKIGNSYYVRIPPKLREHIKGSHNTDITIHAEHGTYGPYLSMWNPEQQGER